MPLNPDASGRIRTPDQELRRLAHKARSVPLPSGQDTDSVVSLNPDASGRIEILSQDLRRENWLIKLGKFCSRVYRIRI